MIERILAPNPSPMTLEGTNTYVVSKPGAESVLVVDPGPLDEAHVARLAALPIGTIVVTHHHADHTEAAQALSDRTGAPVRGADAAWCFGGGMSLQHGEVLDGGGVQVEVVAVPGHTQDSIALWVPDAGEHGAMLTGDTILGRGTTVIMHPDGSVADYLHSLDVLEQFGDAAVLPGHGPELPSLAATVREYREHRLDRLRQVREALASLGKDASVQAVTDLVYGDVDPRVRFAAEASMSAQLEYVRGVAETGRN